MSNYGLVELDKRWVDHLAASSNYGSTLVPDNDGQALSAFMACDIHELPGYFNYVGDESSYSTQQGVKGTEFPNILVVLDDEEGTHSHFSYDKLFGLRGLSKADEAALQEGRDSVLERIGAVPLEMKDSSGRSWPAGSARARLGKRSNSAGRAICASRRAKAIEPLTYAFTLEPASRSPRRCMTKVLRTLLPLETKTPRSTDARGVLAVQVMWSGAGRTPTLLSRRAAALVPFTARSRQLGVRP
ncbi:hypothetical protein Acor_67830 [Acrocarpospora corrugata]|uniref:Uncharacterized protein n=1 Tax=Acrocarpospora corrugata TaxID=35763 RepID=A0A5M3W6R3_9ACTN|nr:hypothetical protein [Acrocarpospora corrugata]GES04715.1 hypothetical protein Acor_67830 [Acrocarpospora corrugata]